MLNRTLMAIALFAALPALADEASKATTAPDNSQINKRDQDASTLTPMDQAKGTKRDVELTRRIRQLVVKEKDLSSDARNVKIITIQGKTTLRGPVDSALEKTKVGNLAAKVVGVGSVTNELEVKMDEPKAE